MPSRLASGANTCRDSLARLGGTGSFALPWPAKPDLDGEGPLLATPAFDGKLSFTIATPFDDPTNPFVHQYHPDHDNKSGATALVAGQESYSVTRQVSFTFAAAPPAGGSATGWGSSVIGGTYDEVVSGLHKQSVALTGSFELRRASELGALNP